MHGCAASGEMPAEVGLRQGRHDHQKLGKAHGRGREMMIWSLRWSCGQGAGSRRGCASASRSSAARRGDAVLGGAGELSLGPGEGRVVTVEFLPGAPGTFSALLPITAGGPRPASINVVVRGTAR